MTDTTATSAGNRDAIDEARWPDVAQVPRATVRRVVGEPIIQRALSRLPITVSSGADWHPNGNDRPQIHLHRAEDFVRRISRSGLIGFGESYMAGDWDSPDLVALLSAFADGYEDLVPHWTRRLRRLVLPRPPRAEHNSVTEARHNVARHYDLSNELFAGFLDDSMSYSSALFTGGEPRTAASLTGAQHRKIDRLLDHCGVGAGSRVLDIGGGWGELAVRAGQRDAEVMSITLSHQQRILAARRVADAGLDGRVEIRLADYRDVTGEFDAVVSVEMIEAVGEQYWPTYFRAIDERLAPGGVAGIQAIVMPHQRMLETRRTHTWIQKYIFPGGLIPSVRAIDETLHDATTLRIGERLAFGHDYADTLAIWRQRFNAAADDLAASGRDRVFARMWNLYLAYSEAGFRTGAIDVEQLVLTRPPV